MGIRGKIGVYGRSLGGIATAHLAEYVDMVIIDRSFGNLYDVAYHKFYGWFAAMMFKIGSLGWRTQNDINMLTRGIDSPARQEEIQAKGYGPPI